LKTIELVDQNTPNQSSQNSTCQILHTSTHKALHNMV
jgi:hypothetical protein